MLGFNITVSLKVTRILTVSLKLKLCLIILCYVNAELVQVNSFNPFRPEFTIVIFIHYKPWIAAAILDLQWMEMICCG